MARTTIVLLVLLVGVPLLQVFLSRRESRWPGLVLPGLCFLYSLLALLSFAALAGMSTGEIITGLLSVFVSANIPTLILLAIYAACREKQKKRRRLEKMSLQDL